MTWLLKAAAIPPFAPPTDPSQGVHLSPPTSETCGNGRWWTPLNTPGAPTDQKVRGSNPFGRAPRNGPAVASAVGVHERIIDREPLAGMRSPPQPKVRLHAPVEAIRDSIRNSA